MNISEWKEGDDPQLVIDFINEVMNDLRPSYSQPGCFTKEQETEICEKYTPRSGKQSFTFYDGKILHVKYKGVAISFIKDSGLFSFIFENFYVKLYEDWKYYGSDTVYNESYKEKRYNSIYLGFEGLLKVKGISNTTEDIITVVVDKKEG